MYKKDKAQRYKMCEENENIILIKRKIIDILHRFMDIQDDIRLTSFLIEFNKADTSLIMDPINSSMEYKYLTKLLNGIPIEDKDEQIKQ